MQAGQQVVQEVCKSWGCQPPIKLTNASRTAGRAGGETRFDGASCSLILAEM